MSEINLDWLNFFHKFFIYDIAEAVNLIDVVCVFRLIQSHGQGRTGSPALIEENSNGARFFPSKIV